MSLKRLQLTLAIFKPDITAQPHIIKEVRSMLLQHKFYFIRSKELRLSRQRAEEFYQEHKGKFFLNRLVSFMSSGPLSAHILARDNAVQEWRRLMGPTKVLRTIHEDADSIRGMYGLTDTRNCTHGSDSPESAAKEIAFFFPEFSIDHWYREDESCYREGKVFYDNDTGMHMLQR
ncbi:nucleoside diphosphate kinase 6-like [Liolophura sinensis]|uniref:nucleoside diphosphate kinase 6-like n=1 Tax=Liolophura sinensis TaxID=3198878 RepID=UPI0031599453